MRDSDSPAAPRDTAASAPDSLTTSRFVALSRLVPLMYFILLANAVVLAFSFRHQAPVHLTAYPAAGFGLVFVIRMAAWWRRRHARVTVAAARRQLTTTYLLAVLLSAALVLWSLALFTRGDAYAQGHVAFYMALTMTCCMFCLIHAPPAPQLIAVCAGIPFFSFFLLSDAEVHRAMAINLALVTIAALIIIRIQEADFTRMVKAREDANHREQAQLRLLRMLEDLPIAVMTVEQDSLRINYANRAAKALVAQLEPLLPVRACNLVGACIDVFHKDPAHQRRLLADRNRLPHKARLTVGGHIIDLEASAVTGSQGEFIGPVVTMALVTAQVEAERRVLQLAHFDPLTGLVNRYTLREKLAQLLARGGARATVLLLDLDGFKTVNDTLGQGAGDLLLQAVASRLQARCAEGTMAVGRVAGDEFAIVLPADDAQAAQQLADDILSRVSAPYLLPDDRQVRIGGSMGIVVSPADGTDSETLLSRAAIALCAAKEVGRGTVRVFSQAMLTRIQQRLSVEQRLRAALDEPLGLFVFFQPIFNIASGRITAREALLRWFDAEGGWISPAEFIPVAEEAGLIDRIGAFVLDQACSAARDWPEGERVAVNVSAAQLGKATLVPAVVRALQSAGLPAHRLEVEVTETALLCNGEAALAELHALRVLGVRVALDDFGTGYSSLAHLRSFSFDTIKIDGSFVRDAVLQPECAAVVQAVAQLGRRLGVTTVAEGVETQAHLDCVRAEGCDEVQGYLLGRPEPMARDRERIAALQPPARDTAARPVPATPAAG
ncbi:putative bifunctional diguanylate cyclase/phosphodiesterase [Aquincola tertiaricarbonis]|uniref:putative bifunctional diguanylate cyclase/phosphodiesterase n=1 Tax=Aquincola tertiaricarbonis TaxID=391953 RepID=UPI000A8F542C|nr:EAL domain-containing protein [Aquincola tertiaricarbonis]